MGWEVRCADSGSEGVRVTFTETEIPGTFIVGLQRMEDERGSFARSWCRREFREHGLDDTLVQCNISFNKRKGTLRGMHYQADPHSEAKLMRCTRGALFDVVLDLRPSSPTFLRWYGCELTPDNGRMFFIPKGCAHGFLTLADETEIFYQMTEYYYPESARGVRWNDPLFRIEWPAPVTMISPRDSDYPDARVEQFAPAES
jgi:dTDP-4-dehydrorhamnose 3,5-epimerase